MGVKQKKICIKKSLLKIRFDKQVPGSIYFVTLGRLRHTGFLINFPVIQFD